MANRRYLSSLLNVGAVVVVNVREQKFDGRVLANDLKGNKPYAIRYENSIGQDAIARFEKDGSSSLYWFYIEKAVNVREEFRTFNKGNVQQPIGSLRYDTLEQVKAALRGYSAYVKLTYEDDDLVSVDVIKPGQ